MQKNDHQSWELVRTEEQFDEQEKSSKMRRVHMQPEN